MSVADLMATFIRTPVVRIGVVWLGQSNMIKYLSHQSLYRQRGHPQGAHLPHSCGPPPPSNRSILENYSYGGDSSFINGRRPDISLLCLDGDPGASSVRYQDITLLLGLHSGVPAELSVVLAEGIMRYAALLFPLKHQTPWGPSGTVCIRH